MKFRFGFAAMALIWTAGASTIGFAETVLVGRFSGASLAGWETRAFKGETRYSFVFDPDIHATVLAGEANNSASGVYRKIRVDLAKQPFLNWSWKVTSDFPGVDENTKGGDDFPARIYVVIERGVMGLSSLSLNYVWASQHPVGSLWPSPFTSQVKLLALDSGEASLGKWVHHKRDLRLDLKAAFAQDIPAIDAVALMTDTDNHGGPAKSFYGDIWFSAE